MRVRRRNVDAGRPESGARGGLRGGLHRIPTNASETALAFERVVKTALEKGSGADFSALSAAASDALQQIDRLADELQNHPNPANLRSYRESVSALLRHLLDGAYDVGQSTAFTAGGRRRVYMLVRRVDAALEELARDVLARNARPLDLAARLDEIRGWLLDLFG